MARPLLLLAVVMLTASGCSAARDADTGTGTDAAASPRSASAAAEAATASGRREAVAGLLAARSAAVLARDVGGWTGTQTVGADVPSWSGVAGLPLATWAYDDVVVTQDGGDRVSATAVVRYRFVGERADSASTVSLVAVRSGGAWRLAAESARDAAAPVWELGGTVWARRGPVSVVGVDVPAADADAMARDADAAAREVGRAWSPVPDVVLVLTATRDQAARGLGRTAASLDGLAAVTSASATAPGAAPDQAVSRVWVDAQDWARLGPVSRAVVLRHELLHVVTGAPASAAVPLWLEEGAAEVVGWRGSGVPLRTAARDLLARVGTDGVPAALPSDDDLAGARSREAYQGAHVVASVLVDTAGLDGLRRLYDEVARSDGTPAALDRALRDVTGGGVADLTRAWQQRLRTLAAG